MTRLLITGATGFIGQALLHALSDSAWEVHAIYHRKPHDTEKSFNWHACDILNVEQTQALLDAIQPDFLIHLAWYVEHPLFWTSEKNSPYRLATVQLYKHFCQYGKKAIFLGTCAEYDPSYNYCDEYKTPLKPNTLYGQTKKETYEGIYQIKNKIERSADFCWIRLFNVFGKYEQMNRLVPFIFHSYFKKIPPVLNNPYAVRDYLFVDNLAALLIAFLKQLTPEVMNVGQGEALSIKNLADIIHQRYFSDLPPPLFSSNSDLEHAVFIPELHQLNRLQITLPYTLEQGLDHCYSHYLNVSIA